MPITVPNYNRKTDRFQFGIVIGIPRNPQEGWTGKLSQYRLEERKCGNHKTVKTWWNGIDLMAQLRVYQNPGQGGEQTVVCLLRDGSVMYYTE